MQSCLRAAFVVCVVTGAPGVLAAQDAIEPDRPDVTNGTHIVDVGLLQVEMGGNYTHSSDHGDWSTPVTARVGLTDWLEARIGFDGLDTRTDGTDHQTGFGNMNVGAKIRLWADPGGIPVLSILPTVNLPTADSTKGFGSGDFDYLLTFLTGTDLGRRLHVDVNYGIDSIGSGEGQPHFSQQLVSASFSAAATDNLNPYVEGYWFSREDAHGGSVTGMDAGAIYELGARYAVDGGLEVELNGASHDVSVFAGLSVVVGNILGNHGVHARNREIQRRRAAKH